MTSSQQNILVHSISHGLNNDSTLYRLRKGNTLQFQLDSNLHGFNVKLFSNHPKNEETKFSRSIFTEIHWNNSKFDDSSFAALKIVSSGSFQFRYTRDGEESGSGFFLVDPNLKIRGETINLDSISMVTVLPKSLGSFQDWIPRLEVCAKSGYNFIHFAPVQELGLSNSSYSIKNQLKLNPIFGAEANFESLKKLIDKMEAEWGILSVCDLVLNHTANETPWLLTNPECGYNLKNSPHLRPAYLLDSLLDSIGLEIAKGKYSSRGVSAEINSEHHLSILRTILHERISELRLFEFWQADIETMVEAFEESRGKSGNGQVNGISQTAVEKGLELLPNFSRLGATIDLDLAISLHFDRESLGPKLAELNSKKEFLIKTHLDAAIENVLAGIRYERIQADGPRLPIVDRTSPLTHRYFINLKSNAPKPTWEEEEEESDLNGEFILAHNGWVMNDDPLRNFADSSSNVYLRRELIAWGDSVKLRFFGDGPESCPFLWDLMKEYTQSLARIFHGIRLDNCHSTPLRVAEYLIDSAREVRNDLYLIAELFTNSDATDNIFVNKLGITSLIREALSAWNSREEGRLIHRFGGYPVGVFCTGNLKILSPSIAHAILFEQTHDNQSPIEKRCIYDIIPLSSLVAFASCATGSSRGYDELVPYHIHVVNEKRFYKSWSNDTTNTDEKSVNPNSGIVQVKNMLNNLHGHLGQNGFTEIFVDQIDPDIVAVTRHNPDTHESLILISYTSFQTPPEGFHRSHIKDMKIEGEIQEILFEASLQLSDEIRYKPLPENFQMDKTYINGLQNVHVYLRKDIPLDQSNFIANEPHGWGSYLKFRNFQPGSSFCIRVKPTKATEKAFADLKDSFKKQELENILNKFSLEDMNLILFRCKEEEESDGNGFSVYNIPNFGSFKYCGLQGIMSVLSKIRTTNDLGHPLCNNLRDGDWLLDYTCGRLEVHEKIRDLGLYMRKCFSIIKQLPRFLIPSYFDFIVTQTYELCLNQCSSQMSSFISDGTGFSKFLAFTSVICSGICKSSPMPRSCISLSAGLPHFSTGYMRNWGRDTFISLPGLFIITGRFQEAKEIILSFGSTLRHGLIPNLLDKGTHARYNCRDATWFWLESIKRYIENCPNGEDILKEKVERIWPSDFCEAGSELKGKTVGLLWPYMFRESLMLDKLSIFQLLKLIYFPTKVQALQELVQESLQRHFEGIHFRERNAGSQIDAHMRDEGFNIDIWVDENTGFIHGGNRYNCGTWMDKMGSSGKAGNKGLPATPRDGASVEIIGLSASVLEFLAKLCEKGKYPYIGVEKKNKDGYTIKWTFQEWNEKILQNFERHFWIGDDNSHDPNAKLINRKSIIKDTFGSSLLYTDYQLRPNFAMALAVSPNLISPQKAFQALKVYEQVLLSKFGAKTLDPSDYNYRGFYDNANDSTDPSIAQGYNYHNGPEWIFPVGYYLIARIKIAKSLNNEEILQETISHVKKVMAPFYKHLQMDDWKGIPELTNKDGEYCPGSCNVQSWSSATLLEALKLLEEIE